MAKKPEVNNGADYPAIKESLRKHVGYIVDDAMHSYEPDVVDRYSEGSQPAAMDPDMTGAVYVVWQCGFEPMVVAVISYLPGCTVEAEEAAELAIDLLDEKGWFTPPMDPQAEPDWREPDMIL